MMQRKKKPYPNLNSYDYSWFAREMTEEELYKVNGGSTVEDNHTVQSGDTLGTLVYNYNQEHGTNLTVNEVAANNGIDNPNLIYVGQQINFGKSDENQESPQSGNTNHTDNISTSETNTNINTQTQNVSYNTTTNTTSQTNSGQTAGANISNGYSQLNTSMTVDYENAIISVDINDENALYKACDLFAMYKKLGYVFQLQLKYEDKIIKSYDNSKAVEAIVNEITSYFGDLDGFAKKLGSKNGYNNIKSTEELLSSEKSVERFLERIQQNPDDYYISVYERKALKPFFPKKTLTTHSLYVITEITTGDVYTLSFNGTKFRINSEGAWGLNTETDIISYDSYKAGLNKYDMKLVFGCDKINVAETAQNIINSINSSTSYFLFDHINDKPNVENCNTALYNTIGFNSSRKYYGVN